MPVLPNARQERFAQELAKGKTVSEASEVAEFEVKECVKPTGYYVYGLVDPGNDMVFYIGKGKNLRHAQHFKNWRSGRELNHAKSLRIRKIVSEGLSLRAICVAEGLGEREAYSLEGFYIRTIGKSVLTNFNASIPGWQRDFIDAVKAFHRIIPYRRFLIQEYLSRGKIELWREQIYWRIKAELLSIASMALKSSGVEPVRIVLPEVVMPNGHVTKAGVYP